MPARRVLPALGTCSSSGHAFDLNTIHLGAANQATGSNALADGNSFIAYNDSMTAGGGDNSMVGDVWASSMAITSEGFNSSHNLNEIKLGAENKAFTGPSGVLAEANNNSFIAFNDTMTSGSSSAYGGSIMVGDVAAGGYGGQSPRPTWSPSMAATAWSSMTLAARQQHQRDRSGDR